MGPPGDRGLPPANMTMREDTNTMKRSLIVGLIGLVLAVSTPAWAWQAQGQQQGQQQGQGQEQGQGQIQGQQGTIVNAPVSDAPTIPNPAPPVFAPNLVVAPETCMGSISGGFTASPGPISFGLSLGKTYVDPECTRRMDARSLQSLGAPDAGLILMAQKPDVAKALCETGRKQFCAPAKVSAAPAAPSTTTPALDKAVEQQKRTSSSTSDVMGEARERMQQAQRDGVQS